MPKIEKHTQSGVRKNSGSVTDRIQELGSGLHWGIKLSLYGQSGTGKTTLWATFPKPILVIVCSGGKKPGELRSINTKEYRKTVKQLIFQSVDDIREFVEYQDQTDEFATVVLDHASGLQDRTLASILGIDELPAQASWGMARQQDWGQCALQMKEMLRALLSLTCNVVIVSQERNFTENKDSEVLAPCIGPALLPSVTAWFNPAADYICQTFKRQKTKSTSVTMKNGKSVTTTQKIAGVEWCLRIGPDPIYTTKFRVPLGTDLPDVIVDPNFNKINNILKG